MPGLGLTQKNWFVKKGRCSDSVEVPPGTGRAKAEF